MLQLTPPIPVTTPRGKGFAHVLIDYGMEYDLCWVVFLDDSGECWTFRNSEIRAQKNLTFGRKLDRKTDGATECVAVEVTD
jgi:hypothetical protein